MKPDTQEARARDCNPVTSPGVAARTSVPGSAWGRRETTLVEVELRPRSGGRADLTVWQQKGEKLELAATVAGGAICFQS